MKRTSTMIYKPTQEATEIYCTARNTREVWDKEAQNIIEYLRKRWNKGDYDKEKAVDLIYQSIVDCANKWYQRYYGYGFTVGDRFTASCDIERYIREEYLEA